MQEFYVINFDFNRKVFEPFGIMRYLVNEYNELKDKPQTFEEFKTFVEKKSFHQFWGRCEYEIILVDWPCQQKEEKWDVHKQVMMNLDTITKILMENVKNI